MTRPECFPCSTFFQSPVRHSFEAFSARPVTRVGPAAFSLGPLPCQPGLVGFPARGANEAVVKKACWKWAPAQIKRGTVRNNPVCCNTVTMGPYLVHAVKQPVLHSMTCPIRETSCNTGASGQKGQCHFSVITSPFTERRTRVNFVGFQKTTHGNLPRASHFFPPTLCPTNSPERQRPHTCIAAFGTGSCCASS